MKSEKQFDTLCNTNIERDDDTYIERDNFYSRNNSITIPVRTP